jgi:hypothetical protein
MEDDGESIGLDKEVSKVGEQFDGKSKDSFRVVEILVQIHLKTSKVLSRMISSKTP